MTAPAITYTPNGARRAPGYINKGNLYDTGYAGQRNSELGGGGKNTVANWNYNTGQPNGAQLGPDGFYVLGGGGSSGGSGGTYATAIPGAAEYAKAALLAKTAYDNAVAKIGLNRQNTLTQYGYRGSVGPHGELLNFSVDPNNPFGQYQQIRRGHALQSQDALSADLERGLGSGGGLAAQDQTNLRYGFGQEDAAMGQGLTQTLAGYQSDLQSAGYERDAALYQAELAAAEAAINNGDFNPADWGSSDGGSGGVGADQGVQGLNLGLNLKGLGAALKTHNPITGKRILPSYKPVATRTFYKPPSRAAQAAAKHVQRRGK